MLIANDEPMQLYILKAIFKKFEFDVTEAINGHQAFEIISDSLAIQDNSMKNIYHHMFDLIVLDLNMPISDGFQACSKILNLYKRGNLFKIQKSATLKSDKSEGVQMSSNSESVSGKNSNSA